MQYDTQLATESLWHEHNLTFTNRHMHLDTYTWSQVQLVIRNTRHALLVTRNSSRATRHASCIFGKNWKNRHLLKHDKNSKKQHSMFFGITKFEFKIINIFMHMHIWIIKKTTLQIMFGAVNHLIDRFRISDVRMRRLWAPRCGRFKNLQPCEQLFG